MSVSDLDLFGENSYEIHLFYSNMFDPEIACVKFYSRARRNRFRVHKMLNNFNLPNMG